MASKTLRIVGGWALLGGVIGLPQLAHSNEAERGSLCVLPYPSGGGVRGRAINAPAPAKAYGLRIDGGRTISLSAAQATLIGDLGLQVQHRVQVLGDGKPVASFRFSFESEGSRELCLWQSDLYQTWQLYRAARQGRACRCRDATRTTVRKK